MNHTGLRALLVPLLGLLCGAAGSRAAAAQGLFLAGPSELNLEIRTSHTVHAARPLRPAEDGTTRLFWTLPRETSKITVSTSCPGQSFRLSVEARNPHNGVATGRVDLRDGMPPTDLVVQIPAHAVGRAFLHYEAGAGIDDGNSLEHGTDTHTITFTLTEQ